MTMKVSAEFFPKEYHHVDFQHQDDSIVVSVNYVRVLVIVIYDLRLHFFVDVIIVNVQFEREFVRTTKFRRTLFAILQMDLSFVY